MEVSSSHQMYVFFLSVLSGLGCGVFFDLQRSLRRLHFAGSIRTTIEDIIFVVVAVGVTIALGFFFNNGQMRYYQVMGSVSGALFYAAFLSRIVMKILKFIYSMFAKIILTFVWHFTVRARLYIMILTGMFPKTAMKLHVF